MGWTVALAGNPNCGKTTLFNALTGENQYVGNWPGVTVEKREADCTLGNRPIRLVDLPGVYSLSPYSIEEEVARGFIEGKSCDAVLNIVDATCLERGLYLTLQLLEKGVAAVVALNMMDEAEKRGIHPDLEILSRELGAPVVAISARKRRGLEQLGRAVAEAAGSGRKSRPRLNYAPGAFPETDAGFVALAQARYDFIEKTLKKAGCPPRPYEGRMSDHIDRVLLHPLGALPAFGALVGALFFCTFGPPGEALRGLMEAVVALAQRGGGILMAGAPRWAASLVCQGVIGGVGGVLTFLPQILILFLGMALLEESGCMARGGVYGGSASAVSGAFRPVVYSHDYGPGLHGHRRHGRPGRGKSAGSAHDHSADALSFLRGQAAHLRAVCRGVFPGGAGADGGGDLRPGAIDDGRQRRGAAQNPFSGGTDAFRDGIGGLPAAHAAAGAAAAEGAGLGFFEPGGHCDFRHERGRMGHEFFHPGPYPGRGGGGFHPGPAGPPAGGNLCTPGL